MVACSVESHFATSLSGASLEWIRACVQWTRGQQQGQQQNASALLKNCWEQWLSTDIRVDGVQKTDLPTFPSDQVIKSQTKIQLPKGKKYTVMILSSLDIGASAYSQLQKLNNVKDDNSAVSADIDTQRPYTANWEPKIKKIRKFVLTDGKQTLAALEHESVVSKIPDPVSPGFKITIGGNLVIRRGHIMLMKKNILRVHGGFVEELLADFGEKKQVEIRVKQETTGIFSQIPIPDLPTQTYTPTNRPINYKSGATPKPKKKPLKPANRTILNDSVFNDDHDDLFAMIDMPNENITTQNQQSSTATSFEDVFDDDCDDLFSQIEMPSTSATPRGGVSKRRRKI